MTPPTPAEAAEAIRISEGCGLQVIAPIGQDRRWWAYACTGYELTPWGQPVIRLAWAIDGDCLSLLTR